jgi:hypothetical protein
LYRYIVVPPLVVEDPAAVQLPRVHGVEYGPDKTTLRAKKYNADTHNSCEHRCYHCLEYFDQVRKKCIGEESQRKADADPGAKKTSARPGRIVCSFA